MPIDTAAKRRSISGIWTGFMPVSVTPDASKGATWRQDAGWGYQGIAVGDTPPPPTPSPSVDPGGIWRGRRNKRRERIETAERERFDIFEWEKQQKAPPKEEPPAQIIRLKDVLAANAPPPNPVVKRRQTKKTVIADVEEEILVLLLE